MLWKVWGRIEIYALRWVGWRTFAAGFTLALVSLAAPIPQELRNFGVSMALLAAFAAPNAWVSQKAERRGNPVKGERHEEWKKRTGLVSFLILLPLGLGIAYSIGTFTARGLEPGPRQDMVQYFVVTVVYGIISTPILASLARGSKSQISLAKKPETRDTWLLVLAFVSTALFLGGVYVAFLVLVQLNWSMGVWTATMLLTAQTISHAMLLGIISSMMQVTFSHENVPHTKWTQRFIVLRSEGSRIWLRLCSVALVTLLYRLGSLLVGSVSSGTIAVLLVELTGNVLYLPLSYLLAGKKRP